ncbi:MAG: PspC domain-containing protein [Vicinamibacterales bacterium]
MLCERCASEYAPGDGYCRACGTPTREASEARRLTRLPDEGRVAGICAGIASYAGVDVVLVRLLAIVLTVLPGAILGGALVYLVLWALVPAASGPIRPPAGPRLFRPRDDRKVAGVCGGLARYVGIDATVVRVAWVVLSVVPGAVVLGIAAYVVAWVIMPGAEPHVDAAPVVV